MASATLLNSMNMEITTEQADKSGFNVLDIPLGTLYTAAGVATSAVTSFYNTGVSVANLFTEDDFEYADTGDWVNAWAGGGAADFYEDHADLIEVGGLIAGSLIPGTLAVKGLKLIQPKTAKALAAFASGKEGVYASAATGLGKIITPTKSLNQMTKAIRSANKMDSLKFKDYMALGKEAFQQNLLESTVYEAATILSMAKNSTLSSEDLDYFESLQNNLGNFAFGAVFGGAVGGLAGTAGSVAKANKAIRSTFEELNPHAINSYKFSPNSLNGDKITDTIRVIKDKELDVTNLKAEVLSLQKAKDIDQDAIRLAKAKVSIAEGALIEGKNKLAENVSSLIPDQAIRKDFANMLDNIDLDTAYDNIAGARKAGTIAMSGNLQDIVLDFSVKFEGVEDIVFGAKFNKFQKTLEIPEDTLKSMEPDEIFEMFDSAHETIRASQAMGVIKKTKAGALLDSDLQKFQSREYAKEIAEINELKKDLLSSEFGDDTLALAIETRQARLDRLSTPDELMRKMFATLDDASERTEDLKLMLKEYPTASKAFQKSGGLRSLFGPSNAYIDLKSGVAIRDQSLVPFARDFGVIKTSKRDIIVGNGKLNYPIESTKPIYEMANVEATARYHLAETDPQKLLGKYIKSTNTIDTYDIPKTYAAMRLLQETAPILKSNKKLKFSYKTVDGESKIFTDADELAKEVTRAKRRAVQKMKGKKSVVATTLDVDESWVTGGNSLINSPEVNKVFKNLDFALDENNKVPKNFQSPRYIRMQYDRSFETEAAITGKINAEQRMLRNEKDAATAAIGWFGEDSQMLTGKVKVEKISAADGGAGLVTSDQAEYGLEAAKGIGATLEKRFVALKVKVAEDYADVTNAVNKIPEGSKVSPAIAELTATTSLARQEKMYFANSFQELMGRELARSKSTDLDTIFNLAPDLKARVYGGIARAVDYQDGLPNAVHKTLVDKIKTLFHSMELGIVKKADGTLDPSTFDKLQTISNSFIKSLGDDASIKSLRQNNKLTYQFKNKEAADAWALRVKNNDKTLSAKRELAEFRGETISYEEGMLYAPPIDTSLYSHVATVKFLDESKIYGSKNMGVIVANNQKDFLEKVQLAKKRLGKEVLVEPLESKEARFKALGEYDADLAITENVVESSMVSKGVLWDVTEEYNENIMKTFISAEVKQQQNLDRAYVTLLHAKEIDTLHSMERIYNPKGAIQQSQRKADKQAWGKQINTMLAIHNHGDYKWYLSTQQKIADAVITAGANVKGLFTRANAAKLDEEFQVLDKYLDATGLPRPYTVAKDYLKLNTNLPTKNLDGVIASLNGAAATVMLRLDQTQALVNAMSMPIMLFPEMQKLKKFISASNLSKLDEMTSTTIQKGMKEPSNMKLVFGATQEFLASPEKKILLQQFKDRGIVKNTLHEMQGVVDSLMVTPKMESGVVTKAIKGTANFLSKPADWSEEFVKFVAGRSAQKVLDLADNIPEDDKWAIIRNFVDKVHGNYTASQRPTLFKGFGGQAIGLFQTYQFNLYQRLFSHLGDDSRKLAATMIGTQAGLFGAQSLPGFQILNEHIASQNKDFKNIYSYAKEGTPDWLNEWFIYGTGSSMFKPIPALGGIDLFSRGDLTPRTPILLPTSLDEIPIVSMAKKAISSSFSAIQKSMVAIGAGEPEAVGTILLEGLAHNGLNRPLAGISQLALDYRTTNQGKLLMSYDQSNLISWNSAVKAVGAKTLDEAVAVNQYYRALKYRTQRYDTLDTLGKTFRDVVRSNDGDISEAYTSFRREYVANGGNGESYKRWVQNQIAGANDSIITSLQRNNTTPEGRYLQSVLGLEETEI